MAACHVKVHDNPRDDIVCYRYVTMVGNHTELLLFPAGHAGTLWQRRVCNSHVLGLHPFAAHLTDPSGVVEVEQVAIETFGTTGMKGPEDAYLRFLLISNMIVDFMSLV